MHFDVQVIDLRRHQIDPIDWDRLGDTELLGQHRYTERNYLAQKGLVRRALLTMSDLSILFYH